MAEQSAVNRAMVLREAGARLEWEERPAAPTPEHVVDRYGRAGGIAIFRNRF